MSEKPLPETDGEAVRAELARLREETRRLRARLDSHPLIAQAQGMLQERYALPDAESAFALLQRASQQFNVKLRTLANAVVRAPRPHERESLWFPRRARYPEPRLSFAHAASGNRGEVLGAVLSQTLAVVGTGMGNVQIADRAKGGLRMEKHTGLTADFVDFFGHVGDDGTACALAAREVSQVTVQDVATHPVFTEEARTAILLAGSRACHSVPLTAAPGVCVGMVSAHLDRPVRELTLTQLKELQVVGNEGGRWLAWYDHTVVRDALEYLHALGRGQSGRRFRRR
ncbi:ANTAR domain-containing protein [Streptomyces phyllanthi]|uniref:ANTAR domain-containing protein n=1 Tax=Streptomyces phyllanthi TaxID=1803180 RepID=A0A5N8W6L1_9ACTN|nr:ANTAR domain-containing protein [Streptomyces phyllanthi]MPY42536.1 ANTAR domain-containing protein [Streptomyces phyllanthi]